VRAHIRDHYALRAGCYFPVYKADALHGCSHALAAQAIEPGKEGSP